MENIHAGITAQSESGNVFNPRLKDIAALSEAHQSQRLNDDKIFGTVMIPHTLIKEPEESERVRKDDVQKAYYTPPETGMVVTEVAMKPQHIGSDEKCKKELISQVVIYKMFKLNENIIKFLGLVELDSGLHLVTEWAELGSLKEAYIEDPEAFTWGVKTSIALDVLRGLIFLHSISIYHHDIRSANVLLTARFVAKLHNFKYG
jgi:serine/threonine protein kinase